MDTMKQEIITGIATNLIEDSIKSGWQKIKNFFVDLDAKDSIEYGMAYELYLQNTRNKYSKIKTLIFRRVPKDLYSFYECIGIKYDGETIDTSSISNLLDKDNRIIITGTGGIGKSTLLKHLYLNAIETTDYIPVLVELRSFNSCEEKEISVKKAIYQNLVQNGFTLKEEYFEYSMERGGYIIFLDGFDEVNRDKLPKISASIRELCSQYGENNYIITSRPGDRFIGWNEFSEMTAMKMNKTQALSLISKIEFDEKIKKSFYAELKNGLFEKYESFASNPLLLTIMLLTYSDHAVFPEKINDFYEQAFLTLFNMHDATKESYVRDIRTGLSCEDFKSIFAYMCFKSYFKDEFEFSEVELRAYIQSAKDKFKNIIFSIDDFQEDLTQSVCMLIKEGLCYRFSHRSFQEYFAALYTCKLEDEIQAKLLTGWLKESNSYAADSYFEMLFNMQPDKVNKIVFLPALKEIRDAYQKIGFSVSFLKQFFQGVTIRKFTDPPEKQPINAKIGLRIGNVYWCAVQMLTCRLNGHRGTKEQSQDELDIIAALEQTDKKHSMYYSFEEILEQTTEEKLLKALSWFENQVLFGINMVESYEKQPSVRQKKKVASIVDLL